MSRIAEEDESGNISSGRFNKIKNGDHVTNNHVVGSLQSLNAVTDTEEQNKRQSS